MFGEMIEWIAVHVGFLGENEVLRKQSLDTPSGSSEQTLCLTFTSCSNLHAF